MGKFTTSTEFISYKIQHNVRHGLKNIPRKGKSWYTHQMCKANSKYYSSFKRHERRQDSSL